LQFLVITLYTRKEIVITWTILVLIEVDGIMD